MNIKPESLIKAAKLLLYDSEQPKERYLYLTRGSMKATLTGGMMS